MRALRNPGPTPDITRLSEPEDRLARRTQRLLDSASSLAHEPAALSPQYRRG
jgi:hypothetical protein